jgi:predicted permease
MAELLGWPPKMIYLAPPASAGDPRPVYVQIASIIAPIFIIAGIGFWWGRTGRPFDTNMVGQIVTNFAVPSLIFYTLTRLTISTEAFTAMVGGFAAVQVAMAAIALPALLALRQKINIFLPSLIFPNNGNMGLPLCLFAFGEPGVALGICAFVVMTVVNFTVGPALASGQFSIKATLRNVHIYAVLASIVFMFTHTTPPDWLMNTTRTLGGMSIPLMLFALGVSLSRLKADSFGMSIVLALVRLIGGFAAGYLVAEAFGFEGAQRGVLILQAAMPTAVVNYLFAARYNSAPGEVAGVIVTSTAISFATLPFLLWVVL